MFFLRPARLSFLSIRVWVLHSLGSLFVSVLRHFCTIGIIREHGPFLVVSHGYVFVTKRRLRPGERGKPGLISRGPLQAPSSTRRVRPAPFVPPSLSYYVTAAPNNQTSQLMLVDFVR